jgi:hypothetical protein
VATGTRTTPATSCMVSSSSLACGVSGRFGRLGDAHVGSPQRSAGFRQWSFVLRRDQQWSTWRILRREDHRIRTSTGRHRGGTSEGTLVFTQVRPRPFEKFPNTLDFDGYRRAHRTLSCSGARARALIVGPTHRRLVDPRLPCPPISDRHRRAGRRVNRSYPCLGNSEGLRRSACPLHSSAGRVRDVVERQIG